MKRTGRTKKMLLRAILRFLEGNNVIVTGFSHKYAITLCRDCKEILQAMHFCDKIDLDLSGSIRYHDKIMYFDAHEFILEDRTKREFDHYMKCRDMTDDDIFMDHYSATRLLGYNCEDRSFYYD